MALIIRSLFKR